MYARSSVRPPKAGPSLPRASDGVSSSGFRPSWRLAASSEFASRISIMHIYIDASSGSGTPKRLDSEIACADENGAIRLNMTGNVFAPCFLLNGLAVCSKHLQLVLPVALEMII